MANIVFQVAKSTAKKIIRLVRPSAATCYQYKTYSQAGEDAVLSFLFHEKKLPRITYLDLGTNKPIWGNNTYLFYTRGSRGVCVEADSTLISSITQERPGDTVLNLGVNIRGDGEVFADFFIFNEPGLNTFDQKEAASREALGTFKVIRTDRVRLITLSEIIDQYCGQIPDLLSIDIEGLDLPVLKSLDFSKYPVPVICAETCTYSENHVRPKNDALIEFMTQSGYFVYADTYINTIFVRAGWF